jgi:hypothetical protein
LKSSGIWAWPLRRGGKGKLPYNSVSEVPANVPKDKRKQWLEVWNSAHARAVKDGKTSDEAERSAFAQANSVAGPNSKVAKEAAEKPQTLRIIVDLPKGKDGLFIQPKPETDEIKKAKREMEERLNRMMFAQVFNYGEPTDFALNPQTFDEKGNYNCGACNKQYEDVGCTLISIGVDLKAGSCKYWEVRRACDRELVVHGTYSPDDAGYGVAANGEGFGCQRCPYHSAAGEVDSQGRDQYCGKGDFKVFWNACCALNGAELEKKAP